MNITLLKPIGYCQGVTSAITKALEIRKNNMDKNIYVFGHLVHNNDVVNYLLEHDIKSIDTTKEDHYQILDRFTKDDIVIFTAHGHDYKYDEFLKNKGVTYFDTTCDLVKKNIDLIKSSLNRGVIYIGKKNHPESQASLAISDEIVLYDIKEGIDYSLVKYDSPIVVNQTTLSFIEIEHIHEDIKKHIPNAEILDERCTITRIKQEKLKSLDKYYDLILVVGSVESSNTDKLYQIAKEFYKDTMVMKIENHKDLLNKDLNKYKEVLITSGASTPLEVINVLVNYLKEAYN